jgi:hypothetical protein
MKNGLVGERVQGICVWNPESNGINGEAAVIGPVQIDVIVIVV